MPYQLSPAQATFADSCVGMADHRKNHLLPDSGSSASRALPTAYFLASSAGFIRFRAFFALSALLIAACVLPYIVRATRPGPLTVAKAGMSSGALNARHSYSANVPFNTYVVNQTADPGDGVCGSTCTLRDAILAANSNPGPDIITFNIPASDSGCNGGAGPCTITLGSALPDLSDDVNINGPNLGSPANKGIIVRRGSFTGDYRVFTIDTGITVGIDSLTISNGSITTGFTTNRGGGIMNSGTLTLTNSTVSGNSLGGNQSNNGGGLYNGGTMTVDNCIFSGNSGNSGSDAGGAIFSNSVATTTITRTTFSSNSVNNSGSDRGGAIFVNGGTVTIDTTTFSANTAADMGGAIYVNAGNTTITNSTFSGNSASGSATNQGGAIFVGSGTASLINSTLSGNSIGATTTNQGAAIYGGGGTVNLTNCTLASNTARHATTQNRGGGVYNNLATVNLRNTIIAGNDAILGLDVYGAFNSLGHNFIGKGDNSTGFGGNGDQVGTVSLPIDPLLGALSANGGPTQTRALAITSTAIDAADNCVITDTCSPALGFPVTTDQRGAGFPRQNDGDGNSIATVDIGAFEAPERPSINPESATTPVTIHQGASANSLIATVSDVAGGPASVTVTVNGGSTATVNGVTLSNIVNSSGSITADVAATCSATNASFTLTATNATGDTKTGTLDVTVTQNSPPELSYNATAIVLNGSKTVFPALGPTDDVGVTSIVLQSQGTYTGSISVDSVTGAISISNAGPAGTHTITIRASDACTFTDTQLTLTVNDCMKPPTSLVDWYPADTDANDVVRGSSGGNGTLMNGATLAPGKFGNAFSLDGVDGFVKLPENFYEYPTTGTSTQPFSFSGWIKTSGSGVILGQQDTDPFTTPTGWMPRAYVGTDHFLHVAAGSDGTAINTSIVVDDNVFHNVVVTYDGATEIAYVDGVNAGSHAFVKTAFASTYKYQFGTGFTDGTWPAVTGGWMNFTGLIDDAQYFSQALSPAEVLSIYNEPSGGQCQNTASPTVISITRATGSPTSATSVQFIVQFDVPVTGVDESTFGDFQVFTTGSLYGQQVTSVTGSGSTYTVTVSNYIGTGKLRIGLVDRDTISQPDTGRPLGGTGLGNGNFDFGQIYQINGPDITSFVVTKTADTNDGACVPGNCSLRDAILAANADPGAETITFNIPIISDPGCNSGAGPCTISLDSALPVITDDVNINGPNLTTPGDNGIIVQRSTNLLTGHFGLFSIENDDTVAIDRLTISNGSLDDTNATDQGAGISNAGTLTLTNSIISGNSVGGTQPDEGGGIYNSGTLTVTNCAFSGNSATGGGSDKGGAIFNTTGTATITGSTFINNATTGPGNDHGGAIYVDSGAVTISNSTITNNNATGGSRDEGGAIYVNGGSLTLIGSTMSGNKATGITADHGGAIFVNGGSVNLINSTLSGNSAAGTGIDKGGAIYAAAGIVDLTNCTIASNAATNGLFPNEGGGNYNDAASVNLRNTILALNTADRGLDVFGAFSSLGHNFIGKSDDSTGFGGNGDQVGSVASPIDPLLGALGSNGGPTDTRALGVGSTAMDGGDDCVATSAHCLDLNIPQLTTDQRDAGFFRLSNTHVDIGAFEVQCPAITVSPATLSNATVGVPYHDDLSASGGTPPYSFAITNGSAPPGLILQANGQWTGSPSNQGTFDFTVNATDITDGCIGARDYSLTVVCPSISLSPTTLANGIAGASYSQAITVQNSPLGLSYNFSVSSGSLPPGLSINTITAQAGAIQGTPTVAGTYNFSIKATESTSGCFAEQAYTLTIDCPSLTLDDTLPDGTVGTAYLGTIQLGSTPSVPASYNFTVTAGTLPTGLSLVGSGTSTSLVGTPTVPGTYNFTVHAAEPTTGCSVDRIYQVVISCQTLTLDDTLPDGTRNSSYSGTIIVTDGAGPNTYNFTITAGSLPDGLTLSPSGASGTLSGTPTVANTFTFTIRATDANGCFAERPYTVVISAPEIDVLGGAGPTSIPGNGSNTPAATDGTLFESSSVGNSVSHTFTIQNTGGANLNLTLPVQVGGTNAADFIVSAQPATPVTPSGSTTFTVRFTPSAAGARNATVTITNDDPDESSYNFLISGTGTDPVCATPPAGLVAWYPGDGNANDIKGPLFANGSLQGAATFAAGKVNQAFSLDGSASYVEVPDGPDVDITGAISIDSWIKTNSLSGQVIVSKYDSTLGDAGTSYLLTMTAAGQIEWVVYKGDGAFVGVMTSGQVVTPGVWTHVAGTFASDQAKIYVDGVDTNAPLVGGSTSVPAINNSSTPLRIGIDKTSGAGGFADPFNGLIDEVELFNTAISAADVAAIYNASSLGKCRSVDLAITKSDGGATVVPGGTVSYTLSYINNGSANATGVVISETVPNNTTFNSGASTGGVWTCTPDANALSNCTLPIGTLNTGASGSVIFAVTVVNPVAPGVLQISNTATIADDGASGADATPADNSATDTTPVDAAPDLSITKSDGGATVAPGGTVVYTLTYANGGNRGATGVVLTEMVPPHTTFNAGGSAAWSCSAITAGSTCTLTIGTLNAASGNLTANFAVTLDSTGLSGVTQISNTATIADDGTNGADPPGNNTGSDTTPVTGAPDFSILKSDGGATVAPGGTVIYTLTYANGGNRGATGVVLNETVPPHTTFNAGSSAAWSCTAITAGSTCTLTIGSLAFGGGNQTAAFAVKLDSTGLSGVTQVSNTASIADDVTNGTDPNLANNSGSDTTPVTGAPDLSISMSDGGASVSPGGTVSYTLFYANAGNRDAAGVVLTDVLPAHTTFNAGASTAGWSCTPDNNAGSTCTLAIGAVAAASGLQTATFALTVDSTGLNGVGPITNTATIADDSTNGADPNPGNNSGTDTTPINCPALTVNPSTLPNAVVGNSYNHPLSATGGTGSYTFAITAGAAPDALILNPDGTWSGTLTTANTFNFTVTATDSTGCASGTRDYTVVITNPVCATPPAGLVAWYPGEGNANDVKGPTFANGSLQGGATFATGKVNQGFSLDGSTGYVEVPDGPDVDITGAISIDAWIKPNALGDYNIVTKYDTTAGPTAVSYQLASTAGGNILWAVYQGPDAREVITDAPVLTAGSFSHVAATFDPSDQSIKIYVDGVEAPSTLQAGSISVTSINNTNIPLRIGVAKSATLGNFGGFFNGLIDEVELFNTAISAADVTAIYNASNLGKCRSVDLSLTKSDGGATVVPGGTVAYTLGYINNGSANATGVVISETVPANSTFNGGASTAGWSCSPNNNALSNCTLAIGTVGPGVSSSAIFAVTLVNPVAAGVLQISNTATIADDGASGADTTPADNTATDTTPVDAGPDLSINKSDGGATVAPGGTVVYTLTYANGGNRGATGVVLTEMVPAHTTFNVGASGAWSCSAITAGSGCTLTIGSLAAGSGNQTVAFAVNVDSTGLSGVTQISNTATIADDGANGTDPNSANNTATDTTPVTGAPDFSISNSDGNVSVLPGGTVVYTLTYANGGDRGATGVVLTETVPPHTTFNAGSSAAWSCSAITAGSTCTLTIGTLAAASGNQTAAFAVTVDNTGLSGVSQISNTATITDDGTNGTDPNLANNTATDTTPVTCATLTVNPATLPNGVVGLVYGRTLSATGGTGPYTFTAPPGAVPTGLTLNSDGTWSGAPSTTGTFTFTVTATDSTGCGAGTRDYTVIVTNCPSTFTVNDTGDGGDAVPGDGICDDGAGHCTLRAAIEEWNSLPGCSPMTINFNVTLPATITLGSELSATAGGAGTLNITGPGADKLTISGNNAVRVLHFESSGATFNLSGLKIAHGKAIQSGGGLSIEAGNTVNLTDCAITDNVANTSGALGFGGGIANLGALTVLRCEISGNAITGAPSDTMNGGGYWGGANSTLTVINSTISGNTAKLGGGIWQEGPSLALTNATITNNSASQGGGIAINGAAATLRNTIVANNTASVSDPDLWQQNILSGSYTSLGHNLIRNPSFYTPDATDITNQDPLLDALSNYGGPTRTHRLQSSSPAIDAGDDCVTDVAHCGDSTFGQLTTDQRGMPFLRKADGAAGPPNAVDIGAFEVQPPTATDDNYSVNEDTPLHVPAPGVLSNDTGIPALAASVFSGPSHALSFTLNADGSFDYTPAQDFNGQDTFVYTLTDAEGSANATVTITVNPVDDAPVAVADGYSTNEDTPLSVDAATGVLANDTDVDTPHNSLLAILVSGPTHAAAFTLNPDGSFSYTPNSNFNGSDSFTYKANDGSLDSNTVTVTINVIAINDPPSFTKGADQTAPYNAGPQSVSNWATNISAGPPDESGQALDFIVTNDNNGLFSAQPAVDATTGVLTYTPAANAVGQATVSVSLHDSGGTANGGVDTSAVQTFTITVAGAVTGVKTVTGDTVPGATFTYTIVLTNNIGTTQADNPGDEFTDVLPAGVTLVSAAASSGVATPDVPNNTVHWNGAIAAAGTVTITITAKINSGTEGLTISNTGTIHSDSDNNGSNETTISTNTASFAVCPASIVVTNSNDSGPGSLRQAILDSCPGTTITFDIAPGEVTSPITLTSGEILLTQNLIINVPATSSLTISGNNASRIFNVQAGASLTIANLTMTGGHDTTSGGGAIFNLGNLTILNSTLTGNSSAGNGGAIDNENGTLRIINSTISGNTASLSGGGLSNGGTSTAFLTNVTITNNRSDNDNDLNGEGGGLAQTSSNSLTVNNTIVAGNFKGTGSAANDFFVLAGSVVNPSSSHNLIGVDTGLGGSLSNGVNGNQVGTAALPINAQLQPLADNGGVTQTHLPLLSSPAVDAGDNAVALDQNGAALTTDQRGFSRILNSTVDIGSVEIGYTITATAGTPQSAVINTAFATQLQATVIESGKPQPGVAITFTPPVSGASGTFSGPATVTTDASGVATAPPFAANGIAGGPYNVVASTSGTLATANFALTNGKADQTIAFFALSDKTFGDADFTVSATATSGLPVSFGATGNCTIAANTVHLTGAGTCTIIASQAGDTNYNPAPNVPQGFTINKVSQTITFAPLANKTFGDPDFTVSATATSGFAVSLSATGNCTVTTPSPGTVHLTGAGACTITAAQSGDTNYNPAADVPQSFTINQASQTITFAPLANKTFGDPDFTVSATATSGLAVSFGASGSCTVSGNTVHITGAGSCTVTASQAGDTNYSPAANVPQSFTINKGSQTITFAPLANKTFGDPDFTVSATAASGLAVSLGATGNCTVTTPSPGTVHLTGAGSCTVTASQAGDTNYNPATDVPQSFTINKANQTITFAALPSKTFGDPDFTVSATATSGLTVSFAATGSCTIAGSTVHITGAGSCNVTASQAGDANYNPAANVPQSFTINKANQTITFGALSGKTFGDPDFTVSATATSGLAVSFAASGSCTISGNTVHITGAGSCTVTASQAGDANYNAAANVPQSFTINKANQTITFGALSSKTFGDPDFTVSATATSGLAVSFAATGNCTITGSTVHLTGAGSCTVTASQAGDTNYNPAANAPQSFTINKASQTITFAALPNKTYGDADFTVSATATSGLAVSFAASGNCTVSGNTVHLTGAGSCTITASQSGDANYNAAANVPQSFTIGKATTTAAVSSLPNPSTFGQNVTFTATISGFAVPTGTVQFKDNGANLGAPVALSASGAAQFSTSSLALGNHTITADYSGDANFLTSTGTLTGGQTVQSAGALIKFSQPAYSVSEGGNFITITVVRSGDTSTSVSVDYATPDDSAALTFVPCASPSGVASPRCDFTTALGTLSFAPGETSKTFTVLISQDVWVEGNETVALTLSNPTGGASFQQPSDANAVLTIVDDDSAPPTTNVNDSSDAFVRQHYHDFLNREADASGLAFWTNEIESCGSDAACREVKRINVSAAFFLSIEFQNTGYFVERIYKSSFGDINPPAVPVPVRFTNFMRDSQDIRAGVIVGSGNWQAQLDANKKAFALRFVQQAAFLNRYPATTTATAFVDSLNANAGLVLTDTERQALVTELSPNPADPALRADVLQQVADNALLQQQEFNRAFVLMQYFGYLRRNPDAAPEAALNFAGYNFWLGKLNQFNGNYINAEMIKAFITSSEYRARFGP